jgi:hypothetical protein
MSLDRALQLPEEFAPWLDVLEAVGPPPGGLSLPSGSQAADQLRQLGVPEPDLGVILEALPSPDQDPELWWLLERAYHLIVRSIGDWDAATPLPSLPSHLGVQGRCFWIFVFLAAAPAIHQWHCERGVNELISWDTLADVGRHVARFRRRTGLTGLDSQFWLALHFRGALYALGRLQFNPYRLREGQAGPLFWYDDQQAERRGSAFQRGQPTLGVHIPFGEPLDPMACDRSFQAAAPFFREHFPAAASRLATCTSWLLDEQLADYLPPTSNIVRFQRRFGLVPGAREDDDTTFLFVFDRGLAALDDLVPKTRLEHALITHVRNGGHWYMRTGWLEL